tara:strand:+ start:407 stop:598 length:192 start_codon:yes stop_codon:yes gene_type:complete
MSELLNIRTWEEDNNNVWVLEEKKDSQNKKIFVLFLEQKGKIVKQTVKVRRRLNKDLKDMFNI